MNIAVFFDKFAPVHETKDPGQIVQGLIDIRIQSEMFTIDKPALREGSPSQKYNIKLRINYDENHYYKKTIHLSVTIIILGQLNYVRSACE